jgi:hypothetical protein
MGMADVFGRGRSGPDTLGIEDVCGRGRRGAETAETPVSGADERVATARVGGADEADCALAADSGEIGRALSRTERCSERRLSACSCADSDVAYGRGRVCSALAEVLGTA